MNTDADIQGLQTRLSSFCKRTLREQVQEYVPYTNRKLMTRPFEPTSQEQQLYNAVSAFLQRKDTYAMPYRQKHLTALIVRKLLASSPLAVAGTLEAMRKRLIALKETNQETPILEELVETEELEEEILEELLEDEQELLEFEGEENGGSAAIEPVKLQAEIDELGRFIEWAHSIGVDTKAKALLKALDIGFEQMEISGAARKAVIFTESRRTQEYVKAFLENNGHRGQVVAFNGTNSGGDACAFYEDWNHQREDLERLAQYIIRNPFSVEKMQVKERGGTIIYRSGQNPKIQRNFEVFTPCDFIAAITQHIPHKSFQLVRYYGVLRKFLW